MEIDKTTALKVAHSVIEKEFGPMPNDFTLEIDQGDVVTPAFWRFTFNWQGVTPNSRTVYVPREVDVRIFQPA